MRAVRIAKRDVDPRKLLILKNVADHPLNADVGPDRKLPNPVRVRVRMRIGPEVALQILVRALHLGDAVGLDVDRQRRLPQDAVARTQAAPHHTVSSHPPTPPTPPPKPPPPSHV